VHSTVRSIDLSCRVCKWQMGWYLVLPENNRIYGVHRTYSVLGTEYIASDARPGRFAVWAVIQASVCAR
jgi:hypothetical protein